MSTAQRHQPAHFPVSDEGKALKERKARQENFLVALLAGACLASRPALTQVMLKLDPDELCSTDLAGLMGALKRDNRDEVRQALEKYGASPEAETAITAILDAALNLIRERKIETSKARLRTPPLDATFEKYAEWLRQEVEKVERLLG